MSTPTRMHARIAVTLLAAVLALASGCVVGPDYVRPPVLVPSAFKESQGWKMATPQDATLRGPWWELFDDAELTTLVERVDISNQTVAAAEANFRQARALVGEARARYFPTASVGVGVTRSLASAETAGPVAAGTVTDYSLPVDISWELDVWGRIRRSVESSQASAQASAADLETARLSTQTELAQDYFQLRALDAEKQLLDATVAAYEKSLELTNNRYASGVASKADVLQAETQLKTTQAQAIDIGVQRAQLEHAIALLVGTPAALFSIPVRPLSATPPAVPVAMPSELLERRPDIASTERSVAAANAQIGVAEGAYYPTVTLSASGGFDSSSFSKWLTWPSRFFSVGPTVSEVIYDGGLRRAQTEAARAAYDASVATYRETVLTGFQEVEDNLAALRILEQEAQVEDEAVRAARQSVAVTSNQYEAGIVSYLNVVIAQTIALTDETTAVQIRGRRMVASVLLIKALGGGWDITDLPPPSDLAVRGAVPLGADDSAPADTSANLGHSDDYDRETS